MPFHSPTFLLLCALTLACYFVGGRRWQHAILLAASTAFYFWAGLLDTVLLFSSVLLNHVASRWVASERPRRRALTLIIAADLGVLAIFKYRGLAKAIAAAATGATFSVGEIAIPLGISFYVFQLIAYQVDLHRGRIEREPKLARLLLYILFFPHHQAGPIMRPDALLPQFAKAHTFDAATFGTGGLWILWGLSKKVIADRFGASVDAVFTSDLHVTAAAGWNLALRYAIQIYGDFSGYSDIAVGLALLLGFRLDRNFHQPYLASSPSELWTRWHVTLSAWLRDYLYIPLGGNRRGSLRTKINLMATMLLGGFWHGASPRFVLWGAIHGVLLVVQRQVPRLFSWRPLGWAITFVATTIAWVPFRAPTWSSTQTLLGSLVGIRGFGSLIEWAAVARVAAFLLVTHAAENALLFGDRRPAVARAHWESVPAVVRGLCYATVILALVAGLSDGTRYIYFRF